MNCPNPQNYLLIAKSQVFPTLWAIDGLVGNEFLFDFKDILNPYRVIALKDLETILDRAQECGYDVLFLDDPLEDLVAYEALNAAPDVELYSPFPNAINGLLPFQVRAYNYLKDLNGGLLLASTGVGKTQLAIALSLHYIREMDHIIFIAKSHNKINVQRAFLDYAGLDSTVIEGSIAKRKALYEQEPKILIANYEKLKLDQDKPYWKKIFASKCLIFWDEMPNKLKHRNTQLYRNVRNLIYGQKFGQFRSSMIRQFILTATPIEHSPYDLYNCLRLINPNILGNITEFENEYVKTYNLFSNKPQTWKNLDKLGLKTAQITYQIDKKDPEIAAQFPKVITQDLELDWYPADRKIYDTLQSKAIGIFSQQGADSILPLIMLMQLMCDLPSAINTSADTYHAWEAEMQQMGAYSPQRGSEYAALFTTVVGELKNDHHTKLAYLKELITEHYPDEKILVFTTFNHLILPALSEYLDGWNIDHVVYRGTNKEKQSAQDTFKQNDNVRVFLSSDAGSDSISLEEASVVIHYDLPWSFATYIQRQNRCHRITSTNHTVRFLTMIMEHSVEQRKMAIMTRKKKYQEKIFDGTQDAITAADLRWILTG